MTKLALATLGLLLAGCANLHKFTPVAPQAFPEQPPRSPVGGSIYQAGWDKRLFEDHTARRVGDLVIVQLVEQTNASKKASTTADKNNDLNISGVNVSSPALGAQHPINLLTGAITTKQQFDGKGESNQSNSLSGQISAIVVDVYPNGNLMIRGEKMLALNQGEEFVQISGVVRPDDIGPDNSVLSNRVADAQIIYGGKGVIADANAMGWLLRFFLSPLSPF